MARKISHKDKDRPSSNRSTLEHIEDMSVQILTAIRILKEDMKTEVSLIPQNEASMRHISEPQDKGEKLSSGAGGTKHCKKMLRMEDLQEQTKREDIDEAEEDCTSTVSPNETCTTCHTSKGEDHNIILDEFQPQKTDRDDQTTPNYFCSKMGKMMKIRKKKEHQQSGKYHEEDQLEELEAEVSRLTGQVRARDVMIRDLEKEIIKIRIDSHDKHVRILQLQEENNISVQSTISNEIHFLMADELQCAICTDFFKKAVTLGCSHTFCGECIVGLVDNLCPLCRQNMHFKVATPTIDSFLQKLSDCYPEFKTTNAL